MDKNCPCRGRGEFISTRAVENTGWQVNFVYSHNFEKKVKKD